MAVLRLPPSTKQPFVGWAEMAERLVFLAFLAAGVSGLATVFVGLISGQPRWVALGAGAAAIAWLLRSWLNRRGRFESIAASFDVLGGAGGRLGEETAYGRLAGLLQELDRLERSRGHASFDPWVLQAVRSEIRTLIEDDPALGRLFDRRSRAT
jgi:hypothetical protein